MARARQRTQQFARVSGPWGNHQLVYLAVACTRDCDSQALMVAEVLWIRDAALRVIDSSQLLIIRSGALACT